MTEMCRYIQAVGDPCPLCDKETCDSMCNPTTAPVFVTNPGSPTDYPCGSYRPKDEGWVPFN
jgi:hypothetical protein